MVEGSKNFQAQRILYLYFCLIGLNFCRNPPGSSGPMRAINTLWTRMFGCLGLLCALRPLAFKSVVRVKVLHAYRWKSLTLQGIRVYHCTAHPSGNSTDLGRTSDGRRGDRQQTIIDTKHCITCLRPICSDH